MSRWLGRFRSRYARETGADADGWGLARWHAARVGQNEDSRAPRLIVGYDGRERSDDALVLGRVLAEALQAELMVAVAVDNEPGIDVGDYNRARAAFFEETFDHAEAVLAGVEFRRVELQDTPAHGLHRLAETTGAALLVVGSSHGPAGRIFPGSVAERLLHGSPCPVAVAPTGYAEKDGWIRSITVAVDGRPPSRLASDFAVVLARRVHAHLTLMRVGPDIRWGTLEPPPVEEIDAANRRSLEHELQDLPADVEADCRYCLGDPAEELVRRSASHDLLVLGSRGYGPLRSVLLGGVSTYVVRNATTPVVVVPRGAETGDTSPDLLLGTVATA
jgi:nucleotide-binding universal stress UspA family protein